MTDAVLQPFSLDSLTIKQRHRAVLLSQLGTLAFSGTDALTFLQGQVTCDLRQLQENNSLIGAYCNRQGRVLAIMHFFYHDNIYYAVLPLERLPIIHTQLKKYILLSKVKIADVSEQYASLGCIDIDKNHLATMQQDIKTFQFSQSIALRWGPSEKINALYDTITHGTQHDWDLAMIAAHFPTILNAQAGHFIPQYIGLDKLHALSFDKGCYIGQEIIARLQYRSTLKKHLVASVLISDIAPQPNDPILRNNEVIGEYINIVPMTKDHFAVLASVSVAASIAQK